VSQNTGIRVAKYRDTCRKMNKTIILSNQRYRINATICLHGIMEALSCFRDVLCYVTNYSVRKFIGNMFFLQKK